MRCVLALVWLMFRYRQCELGPRPLPSSAGGCVFGPMQKDEATVLTGCQDRRGDRVGGASLRCSPCPARWRCRAAPRTAILPVRRPRPPRRRRPRSTRSPPPFPKTSSTSGKLIVGVNVPYTPNEFKDPERQDRRLRRRSDERRRLHPRPDRRLPGSPTSPRSSRPSRAAPSTSACRRSPTPRSARSRSTSSPTSRRARCGRSARGTAIDPKNACGKKVAVQATTTQETDELPAKSKACADAGKPAIEILKFDGQDAATNAVVLGQADAMSADSPVTAYAIKQSNGKLEPPGRSSTPRPTAGR